MNARNLIASILVITIQGVSIAAAGPTIGTAKARGDYRGFNASQSQRSMGYRRPVHQYNAPAVQSSPMIVRSQAKVKLAPQVAQAPVEARRFSYAPTPESANVAGSPCVPSTSAPQAGRRYSYAPAESAAAPAVTAPRDYSGNSGYSPSRSRSSTVDRWSLPKTDPRKFND